MKIPQSSNIVFIKGYPPLTPAPQADWDDKQIADYLALAIKAMEARNVRHLDELWKARDPGSSTSLLPHTDSGRSNDPK